MIRMAKPFNLLRVTVCCRATVLATACGGGSDSSPSPSVMTYSVSATAGTGGSISPSSATVNAGGTTTFTVTPKSGYIISSVTGCAGAGAVSGNDAKLCAACGLNNQRISSGAGGGN